MSAARILSGTWICVPWQCRTRGQVRRWGGLSSACAPAPWHARGASGAPSRHLPGAGGGRPGRPGAGLPARRAAAAPCRSRARPPRTGCPWSASSAPARRSAGSTARRSRGRARAGRGWPSRRRRPAGPAAGPSGRGWPRARRPAPAGGPAAARSAPARRGWGAPSRWAAAGPRTVRSGSATPPGAAAPRRRGTGCCSCRWPRRRPRAPAGRSPTAWPGGGRRCPRRTRPCRPGASRPPSGRRRCPRPRGSRRGRCRGGRAGPAGRAAGRSGARCPRPAPAPPAPAAPTATAAAVAAATRRGPCSWRGSATAAPASQLPAAPFYLTLRPPLPAPVGTAINNYLGAAVCIPPSRFHRGELPPGAAARAWDGAGGEEREEARRELLGERWTLSPPQGVRRYPHGPSKGEISVRGRQAECRSPSPAPPGVPQLAATAMSPRKRDPHRSPAAFLPIGRARRETRPPDPSTLRGWAAPSRARLQGRRRGVRGAAADRGGGSDHGAGLGKKRGTKNVFPFPQCFRSGTVARHIAPAISHVAAIQRIPCPRTSDTHSSPPAPREFMGCHLSVTTLFFPGVGGWSIWLLAA